MVIYGEVLFLENAVIGGLCLWMTRQLCQGTLSWKRLLFGSILCGLYSFTLFRGEIHWFWSITEKVIFSVLLIRLCFDRRRWRLKCLVFYGISFLLGGITMGLFGLLSVPALSTNGSIYMEQMTFYHLVFGVAATILTVRLLLVLIRDYRYDLRTKRKVTIAYRGKEICVQGFMDTGNRLMDPETGRPVCLISPELWSFLFGGEEPLRWISYRGATGFEGLLAVMEPDGFEIGETGRNQYCETILGRGLDVNGQRSWDGCQILLNGCFSEDFMGFGGGNLG